MGPRAPRRGWLVGSHIAIGGAVLALAATAAAGSHAVRGTSSHAPTEARIAHAQTDAGTQARPWDRPLVARALTHAGVDDALRGLTLQQRALRSAQRVIVLSIDGLRPDAIGELTPTLRVLARDGAVARRARTLARSITLPSHVSMWTGVGVARHGIGFNSDKPGRKTLFPSALRIAHRAGLPTAMFVAKKKLLHIVHPGDLDRVEIGGAYCTHMNQKALPWIRAMRAGVAFLHYADPDSAGHREGWMTPTYERAVHRADGCVRDLLNVLGEGAALRGTLLIITSDHGGHGRTHGSNRHEDVNIPWIAYGGAARKSSIAREIQTLDTAATVLEALGLPQPRGIEGRPVQEALQPATARAGGGQR